MIWDSCGDLSEDNNCSWSGWGRWVFATIFVLASIAVLLLIGWTLARRRRRRGLAPYHGTGWMNSDPQYHYKIETHGPPPPEYSLEPPHNPPTVWGHGPSVLHDNQTLNNPLQSLPKAYQPNTVDDQMYTAPAGPPPGKPT